MTPPVQAKDSHPNVPPPKVEPEGVPSLLRLGFQVSREQRHIGPFSGSGTGYELDFGKTFYLNQHVLSAGLWVKHSEYSNLLRTYRNPLSETAVGVKGIYGYRFSDNLSLNLSMGLGFAQYYKDYRPIGDEHVFNGRLYETKTSFVAQNGLLLCTAKDAWCPLYLTAEWTPAAFSTYRMNSGGEKIYASESTQSAWGFGLGLLLGFDFGKIGGGAPPVR